ncbi:hypothetical protein VNO80_20026 [Phaseolus coccineus]|uniref:Uncharacterized protein n=1 Tax=Phaseolus coccineus TaxID=3886 RepID=A0AAN9R0T7_PHACN
MDCFSHGNRGTDFTFNLNISNTSTHYVCFTMMAFPTLYPSPSHSSISFAKLRYFHFFLFLTCFSSFVSFHFLCSFLWVLPFHIQGEERKSLTFMEFVENCFLFYFVRLSLCLALIAYKLTPPSCLSFIHFVFSFPHSFFAFILFP